MMDLRKELRELIRVWRSTGRGGELAIADVEAILKQAKEART